MENAENICFQKNDFSGTIFIFKELEKCTFKQCDFSDADLSNTSFSECEFQHCNFSNAKLENTAFKNTKFVNCKMLGLNFSRCSKFLFEVNFSNCIINFSSFYAVKLKNTNFNACIMQEVDFTDADLTNVSFHDCDLQRAIFVETILEKTDFRTALNYSIDPELNRMKKAKFSLPGVLGLLDKYAIEIE